MPYNSWVQFRRQRFSVGLSTSLAALLHEYPLRPLVHKLWKNHDTFSPAEVPAVLPPWVQHIGGVARITTNGLPPELLEAIRYYGALLEDIIPFKPRIIRGTAGGSVIHDRRTDRLYYAVSRWRPDLPVHPTLAARVLQLPVVQTNVGPVNTRFPNRHAQTCAEFQALNEALFDGAQENNLESGRRQWSHFPVALIVR
jgi:hypothetical protein